MQLGQELEARHIRQLILQQDAIRRHRTAGLEALGGFRFPEKLKARTVYLFEKSPEERPFLGRIVHHDDFHCVARLFSKNWWRERGVFLLENCGPASASGLLPIFQ